MAHMPHTALVLQWTQGIHNYGLLLTHKYVHVHDVTYCLMSKQW